MLVPVVAASHAAQAQTYSVLYGFTGSGGALPFAGVIRDAAGNLYGTTFGGGAFGNGTVFKVETTGKETVVYSFTGGGDGAGPQAGLTRDNAGTLYGTTWAGGTSGYGTVFKVNKTGKETVLYSFTGNGNDGARPYGGVIRDAAGNLYGTTFRGGASGLGTVFKVAKRKETVLHSFTGADGENPYASVIRDAAGNLYGTTSGGGAFGYGAVFKVGKTGKETVLYSFTVNGNDGTSPFGGVIRDAAGNLYGTTALGGASAKGTVFKVDKTGKETVLYSFTGTGNDGANPIMGLIRNKAGDLYGTTMAGGSSNAGTVYKVDSTGKETVLYDLNGGTDGAQPGYGHLVQDGKGNLYGTASTGGSGGDGTVFKLTP